MTGKPVVGVTMGDPAGIGPEVIAAAHPRLESIADVVVIGDADVMREAVSLRDAPLDVVTVRRVGERSEPGTGTIDVIDLDNVDELAYGEVRESYGAASLEYVELAVDLALRGEIDAMATAPINKQATRLAGSEYAGHTGLLAARTGVDEYSMMLIHDELRVTHVSTHVPLRAACDLVTAERVASTIRVTEAGLSSLGVEDPTIAVAGLNPHASDGGLLGEEDEAEIAPAVERAREDGVDVFGPESPDSVFVRAAGGAADCVVAMYHDQGHVPIKMLGFDDGAVSGVNMTVGLPIVRTSVDHGTAFDIAGRGIADETSLVDAVRIAVRAAG